MHTALYRKWRPATFDEVCGQEHITSVLRYEVENGTFSHAYLFSGSRGTGKTTCAKILAKAVNCLHPVNGNPCGECEACRLADSGEATDILEMDAASNTGVDYVREIRENVIYAPSVLKYRVYIIDEVHMISQSAFNAMLKTLEEPPAHILFILATTEPQKIPATILSRCQHFEFRRIASSVICDRLQTIAGAEGISLAGDAPMLIARLSLGGMRDAVSLLELCAQSGGGTVDQDTVNRVAGVASRESLRGIVESILEKKYDVLFRTIEELHASSRDIGVFWQDLLQYYRDLLVVRTAPAAISAIDLTDSEIASLKELAPRFTRAHLLWHCSLLESSYAEMQRSTAGKRLIAELTLVKMCDPVLDDNRAALSARIAALEEKVAMLASAPPAVIPVSADASSEKPTETDDRSRGDNPPASPQKQDAPSVAASAVRTENPKQKLKTLAFWPDAVSRVNAADPLFGAYLRDTKAGTCEDGKITVFCTGSFLKGWIEKHPEDLTKLTTVLTTVSEGQMTVRPEQISFVDTGKNVEDRSRYLEELLDEGAETEEPQN